MSPCWKLLVTQTRCHHLSFLAAKQPEVVDVLEDIKEEDQLKELVVGVPVSHAKTEDIVGVVRSLTERITKGTSEKLSCAGDQGADRGHTCAAGRGAERGYAFAADQGADRCDACAKSRLCISLCR